MFITMSQFSMLATTQHNRETKYVKIKLSEYLLF